MAAVASASSANAQGIGDERITPGSTVAHANGAEVVRANPGLLPTLRAGSLRVMHVSELRDRTTSLNADTVTWATPLPLGFAVSLGASWARPELSAAVAPVGTRVGAYATAELGLGYAISRALSVGLRWRFFSAIGADQASPVDRLDGRSALDFGVAWRPMAQWSLGVAARGAIGPREPSVGIDRSVSAGVAWRPTGTDAFTLGVDGLATQDGAYWTRAGLRLAVPSVGFVRGEALWEPELGQWRMGLGAELTFGHWNAGAGGFGGSSNEAGFWASAGWDGQRNRGIPTGGVSVTVALDEAPGARAMGRLLWKLERLRRDPSVRAVLFAPRASVGGLAHAEELREAFAALQRSGIRVGCHLTDATASTWYACTDVDRLTLDGAGGVRITGMSTAHYFLGPALWNLGVRTDFVRIGDWKSAPEQFTLGGSTRPAREQEEQLLDDFFDSLVRGVSRARHVSVEAARGLVVGGPYTGREAREHGMVDALATLEQAERALSAAVNARQVDVDDLDPLASRRWAAGPSVAVIYVDGDIVDGESRDIPVVGMRMVGDQTVIEAIEAAAASPRVGAIVLRVDSPGGSALASELIWRAVAQASRRKPVVASFGRTAASGGYYVGSAAREIFADPSSLTGSIGIFYGKADVTRLLTRFDVGVELSRRGDRADMESIFRPYTHEERELLAQKIGEFYGLFLDRVATGRHRTRREIDLVGQGHVWSGVRARELGLVDRIGGLLTAIRRARVLAGLPEDHELLELPGDAGGLLGQIARMVTTVDDVSPLVGSLVGPELRAPLGWLMTVSRGTGEPMAMTDWPMSGPLP